MKVSAFTIVRNAVKYDYPAKESIESVLPLCDEFIVCLGNSEDETEQLIKSINSSKIKIVHSVWDDSLRAGGEVLAVETNKAFDAVAADSDWAVYIQADEVIHEQYIDTIINEMHKYQDNNTIDGLLFKYKHFYGNYKYVGDSRRWYRREIRVIKNDKSIRSYLDAQGFRKNDEKLKVKLIDAYIYHYGWVKNPYRQKMKEIDFNKLWHSDEEVKNMVNLEEVLYDYHNIDSLEVFTGTHPKYMLDRIKKMDWDFIYDMKKRKMSLNNILLHKIEKLFGVRLFEYKNYEIV